jgi:hypothetical protein
MFISHTQIMEYINILRLCRTCSNIASLPLSLLPKWSHATAVYTCKHTLQPQA